MKWLKIIRDNARERRELRKDINTAKWRLKSVSIVYNAIEDPAADTSLYIAASTPREGAFLHLLKPSIVKRIREVVTEDLENKINAELIYIKELEGKL